MKKIIFCLNLVTSIILLNSCQNKKEDAKLVTTHADVTLEQGKEVEIHYTSRGVNKVTANAKTVTRHNTSTPYMEFPDGIKVFFYKENKEIESMMTAGYATAVDGQGTMTARDNVEVINEKGDKLNCEELFWDEQKKIIYSNSFVKITTADEVIMGKGMTANETFTDYVIKNITGIVKIKSSELN